LRPAILLEVDVIARVFLAAVALLLNASRVSAQAGSPTPPLTAAEGALVRALAVPDRDAFRQLLATDAVSFFPAEARGPEAIIEKWLPFLVDPALTLALTIDASTTAQSGETGQTAATFAINGRTNKGMRTTPVGTFSIAWRMVEGQWKIATLGGAGKGGKLVYRSGAAGASAIDRAESHLP
jgi:uncharacterized protein DUF4440